MKKYLYIVLLVGVCFGNQRFSRTPIDVLQLDTSNLRTNNFRNEEELLNFIQSTMEANFIPGLSISIAKGGSIVWNKHFGYANINENILVDENTKFILSSASKTITATALMQLFQQDLFMLDDDVDNYLPFDVSHPDYPEIPITFKMLLSHTSGIKDNWGFMPFYDGDSPLELSYYLSQYFSPLGEFYDNNLNFTDHEPGTGFRYSNIGAALVGLLVEEISNQSFNEYCIENIFEPLGMSDAYWFLSEIENLNEVASPHQFADGSTDSLIVLENYGYSDYPAGQLRTTSYNLAKFMNLFINDGIFDDVEILSPETIELMKTIHYPNVAYDQGLMWYYKTLNNRTLFGHSGSDKGSLTEMFISFPDTVGVILLSNSRNHEGMAQIENAVFNYAVETDFTTGLDFECIAEDGTEGIEVWGQCYSIQNTENLYLSNSGLSGEIPSTVGSLINLEGLHINDNDLTGELPSEISNLNNLIILDVSNNQLSGEFPQWISNLNNLIVLELDNNNFSGNIPDNYCDLPNVGQIDLRNNNLCPPYPDCLADSENQIVPQYCENMVCPESEVGLWGWCYNKEETTILRFYSKDISGEIPAGIGEFENLERLDLRYNQLSGEIPPEIGNLTNLLYLQLNHNQLTGEIPPEIGNLINLQILMLNDNSLSGQLPESMANLVNLSMGGGWMIYDPGLSLSNNNFSGEIPSWIGDFENLRELDLSGNQFSGIIPEEIGNLSNLLTLKLNDNLLTGDLPNTIYQLNLSDRNTGHAPAMTLNPGLDISNNQLSGIISNEICNFSINWSPFVDDSIVSYFNNNNFCPPYPSCIENSMGIQDTSNCQVAMNINSSAFMPHSFSLSQNYPNPFNPTTQIQYDLPELEFVSIDIYDLMGRRVKSLINNNQDAGYRSVYWNATNDLGQPVSAGMYIYTIQAGEFRQTRKMVLLK